MARRLVFAHRGGAALRPENTLAAFDHAVALGADGLELDVRLSRDGEVVVIHDATLDRTTDARGPVKELTVRELSAVDAGHGFIAPDGSRPYRSQGLGVPCLTDVLRRYPGIPMIVELKGESADLARAAVAAVRAAGGLGRVCFGSFEDPTLAAARGCGRDVVTGAGSDEIRRALWLSWLGLPPRCPRFAAFQVPERHGRRRVATRRFIRAATRGRLPVQVWTVDDVESMRQLLHWGAQAIITDRPDIAVPVVRSFNEASGH
jgi:glycerophosphoryl diester phosphodiesterase